MKNLIIGNTSQLSYYFPDDYIKISSRNIDKNFILSQNWNRVYICFGESRKFIDDIRIYDDINFYYTLEIINLIKNNSQTIIVYSTCELWNQVDGKIDISMNFNFYNTPYLQSKYKLSKYILSNKVEYFNVFILYPFNFNSIHRDENFLFGKIFNSIINKKTIEIGNTYFYRDIIHPRFVVEKSMNAFQHEIVGSGRLTFVNDFIKDIYKYFNMDYNEYVIENISKYKEYEKIKEYYYRSNNCQYNYHNLLTDTILDIEEKIKLNNYG